MCFCHHLGSKEARSHSIFTDVETELNKMAQTGFSNYKTRILPFHSDFLPGGHLLNLLCPGLGAIRRPYLYGVGFPRSLC